MNYLIDKSTGMFVLKEFRMLGGQSEVSKAIAGKYKKPVSDGTSGSDSTSPTESGSPSPAPSEEDVVKYLQNIKVAETTVENTYNFIVKIDNNRSILGSSIKVDDSNFDNVLDEAVSELVKVYRVYNRGSNVVDNGSIPSFKNYNESLSEIVNISAVQNSLKKNLSAPSTPPPTTSPASDFSSLNANSISNLLVNIYYTKVENKTYNFAYIKDSKVYFDNTKVHIESVDTGDTGKLIEVLSKLIKTVLVKGPPTQPIRSKTFKDYNYKQFSNFNFSSDKILKFSDSILYKIKTNPSLTESKILKEYREEINSLLIPSMQKQLKFNTLPTLNFVEDEENAKDMFGRTAHYNPNTSEITVYISGRHPKDIMRSVAHEVVHHAQNCRGEFDNAFNLGEEGYAQSNNHLRKMEKQAYLLGNMLFRDWEDNLKKQRNTTAMINEQALRAKIRQLIAEAMQDASEVENAPTSEQHDKSCSCPECTDKRNFLRKKSINTMGKLAEATRKVVQEDKETMPLNEWRRLELNSLLLNRFGIVSPEVLGEKKSQEKGGTPKTARQKELAAKTPPHDKITRGDVIKAATEGEETEESGGKKEPKSNKPKKGQIPPQLKAHVKGKKHESK